MYTEYVFENKKYEVAARDIKATLFDIVSTEEGKISDLREKAFIETNDPQVAQELQTLYVQQDGLLREVLAASDNLYKTLEKVDTCSRKLKQIENKNLAQIVATIHGDTNEISQEAVQQQVENNEINPPAAVVEENVQVEEQQPVNDEGDSLAAEAVAETTEQGTYDETNALFADENNKFYENGDEVVLVPNDKTEEATGEQQQVTTDEANKLYADDKNSFYENGDEVVLVPNDKKEEATEEQQATDNTQPQKTQNVPEMVDTGEAVEANEPVMTPAPEVVEEPVMTSVSEEVTDQNTTVVAPAAEETVASGPLITPVSEEQPMLVTTEAETSGPLLQPVQEESTGLPLPVITPDASSSSLTFKKRTDDQPKVIMISGVQASKLRASLPTQEALLSAKGMFQTTNEVATEAPLEQQLVNNGLLEPDTSAKQAQIEQMMEQANALYSAGRVEEAQNMYNQISVLNKELQGESAGLTK